MSNPKQLLNWNFEIGIIGIKLCHKPCYLILCPILLQNEADIKYITTESDKINVHIPTIQFKKKNAANALGLCDINSS